MPYIQFLFPYIVFVSPFSIQRRLDFTFFFSFLLLKHPSWVEEKIRTVVVLNEVIGTLLMQDLKDCRSDVQVKASEGNKFRGIEFLNTTLFA